MYAAFFISICINGPLVVNLLYPNNEAKPHIFFQLKEEESLYQVLYFMLFCYTFGLLILRRWAIKKNTPLKKKIKRHGLRFLFFITALFFGRTSQILLFKDDNYLRLYIGDYAVRLLVSSVLIILIVELLLLRRDRKTKEIENANLKSAYYDAELKNLKAQVNPHFLFNSFSSLSSLIEEDVPLAQKYVANLAKVFRYSLSKNSKQLVNLSKEIELLEANVELLKIRYEEAISIVIDKEGMTDYMIPFMSLQPLLENVTKHNLISIKNPTYIKVYVAKARLFFVNGITAPKTESISTGIGLLNLNERYRLLLDKEIEIQKTNEEFCVRLPLHKQEH